MGRYSGKDNARSRVLSDDELRAVWKAADQAGYLGEYIKFLLLTAARRKEAAGLQWDEIESGTWLLPASRNKTGVPLARPLSKAALQIIANQPRLGAFVFTFNGKRKVSAESAVIEVRERCGINDWRLHDLRRTARTLLSRAGINPDIAERCLGHAIPGIRATYDRHPFKREMAHAFEALAHQIDIIVNPADNVTPMRRARHADA
jgi:integrase